MAKTSERPSVNMTTYEQAGRVLTGYKESCNHLRSLIEEFIPDGKLIISCSDDDHLKHCGRTIRGVAKRFFNKYDLLNRIHALPEIKDQAKRGLADDRICIQMEELRGNHLLYLQAQYDKAKTKKPINNIS